jgi:hypothetical protein
MIPAVACAATTGATPAEMEPRPQAIPSRQPGTTPQRYKPKGIGAGSFCFAFPSSIHGRIPHPFPRLFPSKGKPGTGPNDSKAFFIRDNARGMSKIPSKKGLARSTTNRLTTTRILFNSLPGDGVHRNRSFELMTPGDGAIWMLRASRRR